jgi:murein L,D-transpeptidase YcbB/YkuD
MNGGSALIKAIQRKVGANPDGYIGKDTITKMQKWLGTYPDGVVSNPSAMVKAFQHWLNQQ